MRQKASAARVPAPQSAPSPSKPADSGPPTLESLGRQLREVFPNRRLHSISLCDHEANCLWLSEGALGPDEHTLVTEALERLSAQSTLLTHEVSLEDARFAVCLAVRSPTSSLLGIAMILADGKSPGEETQERLAAAPVRNLLMRIAVLMKPSTAAEAAPVNGAGTEAPMSPAEVNDLLEADFSLEPSGPSPVPSVAAAPAAAAVPELTDPGPFTLVDDPPAPAAAAAPKLVPAAAPTLAPAAEPPVLQEPAPKAAVRPAGARAGMLPGALIATPFPVPPPSPAAVKPAPLTPIIVPVAPAIDPNLLLEVLPFGKLRTGGQTRRFQVLPRVTPGKRDPAALDALILQRLMAWLAAHRSAWSTQPTGFTLNLSVASLEDERFAHKAAAALNSHGISPETLGFEITEALCTQRRAQVERFLAQCEKTGSWVVIDDFSFDSQVLPLMRSKAVRLVKIDPKLTSCALKDKLAQALVVATVQAAKVLGIHCAAKKVDSQAALQWLTAIGCDFAQGAALAGTQTLESLAPPVAAPAAARPANP